MYGCDRVGAVAKASNALAFLAPSAGCDQAAHQQPIDVKQTYLTPLPASTSCQGLPKMGGNASKSGTPVLGGPRYLEPEDHVLRKS